MNSARKRHYFLRAGKHVAAQARHDAGARPSLLLLARVGVGWGGGIHPFLEFCAGQERDQERDGECCGGTRAGNKAEQALWAAARRSAHQARERAHCASSAVNTGYVRCPLNVAGRGRTCSHHGQRARSHQPLNLRNATSSQWAAARGDAQRTPGPNNSWHVV